MNRFARTGETDEPCGVPRSRSCKVPSGSCSGAASHRFTYSSTHGSVVFASTALMMRFHGTLSKNFRMSKSITQLFFQHRFRHAATASSWLFRGRYPLPLTCRTYVSWCPVPLQLVTGQQQVGHRTECGCRGADMTTEPLVGRVVSSQKRP